MLSQFASKTAVITGAASGLGREIAKLGSSAGMNLILVDFNSNSLDDAAHEISGAKSNSTQQIRTFTADVSDIKKIRALGEMSQKDFGAPHFVFNNAGIARSGLCWEHTPEEWKSFLDINVMGVVNGIHVFTPMMLAAARADPDYRGRIINTASMAGLVSMPISAMYNVSKHSVVTLTETLYHDLSLLTNQVSASVLCPFFVPTNIDKKASSPLSEEHQTPSQLIGDAFTAKAIAAGKVSSAQVAQMVFDALSKDQFYIYSHPGAVETFKTRSEDITLPRNPTNPFAAKPEIGEMLGKKLRKAYKF